MEHGSGNDPRLCTGVCVATDAERYTSVAEGIDPSGAMDFVNRYLEVVFRPVYQHGGFVADVRGDGMLAVWTAASPGRELRARVCLACLDIAGSAAGFAGGLRTRIGAHFGPIALGAVGTAAHREYRAVGDTVNTSSRLEQLNKELGTRVLVCSALAEGLDEFVFRDLGAVQLRGKRNRVRVLELMAQRDQASRPQLLLAAGFAALVAAENAGRWHEAADRARGLLARFPEDLPTRLHARRCEQVLSGLAGPRAPERSWGLAEMVQAG